MFMQKKHCSEIALIIKTILEKLRQDRQWFHAHPELGFEEKKTAQYIRTRLQNLKIPFVDRYATTGMVAKIEGRSHSKHSIGFRTDMDALCLKEENLFSYRSTVNGKMHGCGHDGHMAILLGLAEVLAVTRCFDGIVYLVFQPAEEGGPGARTMMEQGLFKDFPMEKIFALHNWPDLPAGVIGSIKGPMMASAHSIAITIAGKGGHGAMPHLATPQMTIAAHVQLAINSYLAQKKDTRKAAIISPTQITAGDAFAVIPKIVTMKGSCRFLDEETTQMIYRDIPPLVQGIAASFGADAHVELRELCSVTENDSDATDIVRSAAAMLDLEQAQETNGLTPAMVSEDFAYMLKDCPGCYFWLGQNDREHQNSLHQPHYDFNDDTIEPALSLLAKIASTALLPASS